MSAISFIKKADTQPDEKTQKTSLSCPICRGIIKPGYDTQLGRVVVCESYPKNCTYIVKESRYKEVKI
jgi:hypothetical protein